MQADGTWTVLVVDSDSKVRNSLVHCLEEDYRVLSAPMVAGALAILAAEEIDLILCEQRMP